MDIKLDVSMQSNRKVMAIMTLLFFLSIFSFQGKAQTFEWAIQLGSKDASTSSYVVDLDTAGNAYLAGTIGAAVDFDPGTNTAILAPFAGESRSGYIAKYDPDGNFIWVRRAGGGAIMGYDRHGSVYVLGNFKGKAYFDKDSGIDSIDRSSGASSDTTYVYLIKYDLNGNSVYAKCIASTLDGLIGTNHIAFGSAGEVYLTGYYSRIVNFNADGLDTLISRTDSTSNRNGLNVFLAKYDPDGNYVWAKGLEGTHPSRGRGIAIDTTQQEDYVYITGNFQGLTDFDPGPGVATIASNVHYSTQIGGNMSLNPSGAAYIAKYDSSGAYVWANAILPDTIFRNSRTDGVDIAVDVLGNVLFSGQLIGSAKFYPAPDTALIASGLFEMCLAKYDKDGNYLWAGVTEGAGSIINVRSMTLDKGGNSYIYGNIVMGTVDFDFSSDTAMLRHKAFAEPFIAQYDACGNYIWAGNFAGGSFNGVYGEIRGQIAIHSTGDLYHTGGFEGTMDFDPEEGELHTTTLTSYWGAAGGDGYLSKLHFDIDSIPTTHLVISECSESFSFNGTIYTTSGIYKQVLRGIKHCDSIIILDLTFYQIDEPVITTNEFTLGVNNTYATYQWLKDGVAIPGATDSIHTVTDNGEYQVVVISDAGCTDTSEIYKVDNYTGIKDIAILAEQISVYPNPSEDIVHIQSPVPVNITLTDIAGRIIMEVEEARDISLKHLASGIYLMQLKGKEDVLIRTIKVAKQ